jgi:predicted acyltransferase
MRTIEAQSQASSDAECVRVHDSLGDEEQSNRFSRLLSLDAFRGLSILLMLLGSNAGDWDHVFSPLKHSEWFGCTLADVGFPFFLFIMGAAVPLSISSRLEKGDSIPQIVLHALRRSAILVALGLTLWSLHWLAYMDYFRFYGVLQRIAIVYLVIVIIELTSPRYQVKACIAGGLLLLYLLMLSGIPFPGTATDQTLPDLSSINLLPITPEKYHNVVDSVDNWLLAGHLYESDNDLHLGHDPEGLLSTIPSISTGLLGALCSSILLSSRIAYKRKPVYLALAGVLLIISGLLFQGIIPFAKELWTPSFVLYTAGWAYLVFSMLYWTIDQKGFRRFADPLIMYGRNPILIYFAAATLMYITVIIRWTGSDGHLVRLKQYLFFNLVSCWATPLFGPYVASAMWGLLYIAAFGALAWWLGKREIYVKI